MQVIWQEFLKALGVRVNPDVQAFQVCPAHDGAANNPSLRITFDPDTRDPYFTCVDQRCRFHGNAVTLVRRKLGLESFRAAVDTFKHGAQYWSTLTPEVQADTRYLALYPDKRLLRAQHYVDSCSSRLNDVHTGARAREALHAVSGIHIPPDVGLYTYNRTEYVNHLVYPYTYNHKLISVHIRPMYDLQCWDAQDSRTVLAIQNTYDITNYRDRVMPGVFMESNISQSKHAYVTLSELDACALYSNFMLHSFTTPPVAAITGCPLPASFNHLQHLCVVLFKHTPWNLRTALDLFNAPTVEDNTRLKLHLMFVPYDISELPPELHIRLGQYPYVTLVTWIIQELNNMCVAGNYAQAQTAIDAACLTAQATRRLRRLCLWADQHNSGRAETRALPFNLLPHLYTVPAKFHKNNLSTEDQVVYTARKYRTRNTPQLLEDIVENADAQLAPIT